MASTRNINTPGNYKMEQQSLNKHYSTVMYAYKGKAYQSNFAGDGLLVGNMKGRDLARNDCDIESYLFGIGSTNLVQPLPIVQPQINSIQSLNIFKKSVIIPSPIMSIEPGQRNMYLN
jgi:hypothetical protein